jgi:hypothetical protein
MLWFGALAGAIAWSLHLLVAYALVGVACATGLGILIDLTTLVTALVTVAGGVAAWRNWRRPEIGDGGRLLAVGGMLLNGMFLFAILVEGYPNLVLGPCWYG